MSQHCHFDASRSLTALEQDSTIIAVIEMSQAKWLVAGVVPGVERQPLKRLAADEAALLKLLHRWRNEAGQAGRQIKRIVVAYEAGRDGFWLARWLQVRGVEAYVIHPTSISVSREHRRAKTDRLDTELLMRAFLGWLFQPWTRSPHLRQQKTRVPQHWFGASLLVEPGARASHSRSGHRRQYCGTTPPSIPRVHDRARPPGPRRSSRQATRPCCGLNTMQLWPRSTVPL